MKAIVQTRYGSPDDLELREIARPEPADDEVLVRVRAASVHPDVWHVLTGLPRILRLMGAGLRRPRNPVPGTDLAGVVEAAGRSVTRFRPGDEVFGETLRGMQWVNGGAYAEYATAPERSLALKPAGIGFEQAAAAPTSALIALRLLRQEGKLREGHRVLVNGAGGGLGTLAVQLAKAFGAAEVTGVDRPGKLDLVRALGADHVLDCTRVDFTLGEERYDLVLDVPGNRSLREIQRVLRPGGVWVLVGHAAYDRNARRWLGELPRMFGLLALSPFVRGLPRADFTVPDREESMALLRELLETGKLTPHVDRAFPLSRVADAIRYLERGQAKGKVVVTIPGDDAAPPASSGSAGSGATRVATAG